MQSTCQSTSIISAQNLHYHDNVSYLGTKAITLLLNKVIRPTPVIARVFAYPLKGHDNTCHLVVHFLSDSGEWDSIVQKLILQVDEEFASLYVQEHVKDLNTYTWAHTNKLATIPERSQLLYLRPPYV